MRRFILIVLIVLLAVPAPAFATTDGVWTIYGDFYTPSSSAVFQDVPFAIAGEGLTWEVIPGFRTRFYNQGFGTLGYVAPVDDVYTSIQGANNEWTLAVPNASTPATTTGWYTFVGYCSAGDIGTTTKDTPKPADWGIYVKPYNTAPGSVHWVNGAPGSPLAGAFATNRIDPTNLLSPWKWPRNGTYVAAAGEQVDPLSVNYHVASVVVLSARWNLLTSMWDYYILEADGVSGWPQKEVPTNYEVTSGSGVYLPVLTHHVTVRGVYQQIAHPDVDRWNPCPDSPVVQLKSGWNVYGVVGSTQDAAASEDVREFIESSITPAFDDPGQPEMPPPSIVDSDTTGGDLSLPGWLWEDVAKEVTSKIQPAVNSIVAIVWPLKALADLSKEVNP